MNLKRAGRVAAVLAAVCGAGLGQAGAAAAAQTVAWGTTASAPDVMFSLATNTALSTVVTKESVPFKPTDTSPTSR